MTLLLENKKRERKFERGHVNLEKSDEKHLAVEVDLKRGDYIYQFKLNQRIFIDKFAELEKYQQRTDLFHTIKIVDPHNEEQELKKDQELRKSSILNEMPIRKYIPCRKTLLEDENFTQ